MLLHVKDLLEQEVRVDAAGKLCTGKPGHLQQAILVESVHWLEIPCLSKEHFKFWLCKWSAP
eukprot:8555243-Prorocentrum_lima.AAC.1